MQRYQQRRYGALGQRGDLIWNSSQRCELQYEKHDTFVRNYFPCDIHVRNVIDRIIKYQAVGGVIARTYKMKPKLETYVWLINTTDSHNCANVDIKENANQQFRMKFIMIIFQKCYIAINLRTFNSKIKLRTRHNDLQQQQN